MHVLFSYYAQLVLSFSNYDKTHAKDKMQCALVTDTKRKDSSACRRIFLCIKKIFDKVFEIYKSKNSNIFL